MKTTERLAAALKEANAPEAMVENAYSGKYDDYESDSATPINDLINDCRMFGLEGIRKRAIDGEFDGTREESEAWMEREGKYLLREE